MALGRVIALVAGLLPCVAIAQDAALPASNVTPTTYNQALPDTGARVMFSGAGPSFMDELYLRDMAGIFDRDTSIPHPSETDVLILVSDSWVHARGMYLASPLPVLADEMPTAEQDHLNLFVAATRLDAPNWRVMQVLTFVRTLNGSPMDERCMARMVVDYIYRGEEQGFNVALCSREIE